MQSRWLLLLAATGGLLLGCNETQTPLGAAPAPSVASPATPYGAPPGQGILTFSTERSDMMPAGETSFALSNVVDLGALVTWQGGDITAPITLAFMAPDGQTFLTLNVDPHGSDGVAFAGGRGVWGVFPIGGTSIAQHGLVGTWNVEARLADGTNLAAGTFTLTQ